MLRSVWQWRWRAKEESTFPDYRFCTLNRKKSILTLLSECQPAGRPLSESWFDCTSQITSAEEDEGRLNDLITVKYRQWNERSLYSNEETTQIWISESLWDLVKIHWILDYTQHHWKESSGAILTKIQWIFTESETITHSNLKYKEFQPVVLKKRKKRKEKKRVLFWNMGRSDLKKNKKKNGLTWGKSI